MSEQINLTARIEYLVRRRFPNVNMLRVMPSLSRRTPASAPDTSELRKAVGEYRAELLAITHDELVVRYNAEQSKEREEARQRRDREERESFFNLTRTPIMTIGPRRRTGHLMKRLPCLSGERPKSSGGISSKNSARWVRRLWRNMRADATLQCGQWPGSNFSIQCCRAFSWLGLNEQILPFRQS